MKLQKYLWNQSNESTGLQTSLRYQRKPETLAHPKNSRIRVFLFTTPNVQYIKHLQIICYNDSMVTWFTYSIFLFFHKLSLGFFLRYGTRYLNTHSSITRRNAPTNIADRRMMNSPPVWSSPYFRVNRSDRPTQFRFLT